MLREARRRLEIPSATSVSQWRFNDVFVDHDVTTAQICTTGDLTWTAERVA